MTEIFFVLFVVCRYGDPQDSSKAAQYSYGPEATQPDVTPSCSDCAKSTRATSMFVRKRHNSLRKTRDNKVKMEQASGQTFAGVDLPHQTLGSFASVDRQHQSLKCI